MSDDKLSVRQLNRATLARQILLERESVTVPEAITRLCGLQSQEPRPPFIGLWARLYPFHIGDLTEALHSRQVVRAPMMRGTLHIVTTPDFVAFRSVLQPMLSQAMRVLGDRARGLDLEKVLPAAHAYLSDGPRTFDETRGALRDLFPEIDERALGFATRMHIPLVMSPTSDRWGFPSAAAFALAETWLGTKMSTNPEPHVLMGIR